MSTTRDEMLAFMRAAAAAAAALGSSLSAAALPVGLREEMGLRVRSLAWRAGGDRERRSKRDGRLGSVWSKRERFRGSSDMVSDGRDEAAAMERWLQKLERLFRGVEVRRIVRGSDAKTAASRRVIQPLFEPTFRLAAGTRYTHHATRIYLDNPPEALHRICYLYLRARFIVAVRRFENRLRAENYPDATAAAATCGVPNAEPKKQRRLISALRCVSS
jgi:hypothetical protein